MWRRPGSLQPHGFISREGIKDLQFYFPQLCETRCLISFFLSFFFAYALKPYRAIFPLFLSLSLPLSLSLSLSLWWLCIDAWNAIRIFEGSKPVDFVPVTSQLVCTDWDEARGDLDIKGNSEEI